MLAQEHPTPPGALVSRLPFPQGSVTACAHISVAVTSVILRNADTALIAPLVVDQAAIKRGTARGITYHGVMLAARRRNTPNDKSTYFSPGAAVDDYKKRLLAENKTPWFEDRHESGYVTKRAINDDDALHQRLVDERVRAAVASMRGDTGPDALAAAVAMVVADEHVKMDSALAAAMDAHHSAEEALRAAANDVDRTRTRGKMSPRLVDELDRAYRRATVDHRPQGMVLTSGAYTRSVIFREDGLWLYDSHGIACSGLYYFCSLDALATFLLRSCGVTDDTQIAENLSQMNDPSLRKPDCEFDATVCAGAEFEIVVLECCDHRQDKTPAAAAMDE